MNFYMTGVILFALYGVYKNILWNIEAKNNGN